jgi:hypothetical protein
MMKALRTLILTCALSLFALANAGAQTVAVGTNLLYWATGTINLNAEMAIAPKTTINMVGTYNIPEVLYFGDKARNRKLWHWSAQPEIRFWHKAAFNRSFWGIHAVGGAFDAGGITLPLGVLPNFGTHRYEGWMAGAGVSYGWQWLLSPHWNFEATFGFGYMYMAYTRFSSPESSVADQMDTVHHYFGPTRIGLSFSYLFRSKK